MRARRRQTHVAIISSNVTLWICVVYLAAAFFVTLTWYVPAIGLLPKRLEQWMYPIDKTDLDVLRFAHFLALAAITVRFLPRDWRGLKSRWLRPVILCGQHSLEIFCLGVFLAFAGHFILAEVGGGPAMHALISLCGIRHHVRSGVADFVVQASGRQEGPAQGRNRQCRSGGRNRMRPRLLLVLACLTGLLAAQPLRAEDAPQSCDVPDNLLATESALPKTADAIKAGKLDILVIGSRSSTIVSADSSAYPARLQAALQAALPKLRSRHIRRNTGQEDRRGSLRQLSEAAGGQEAYFGHLADRNRGCYAVDRSRRLSYRCRRRCCCVAKGGSRCGPDQPAI